MTFLKTERTFLTIECPPSTTSGRYSTKIEFFVDSGGFRVAVFAKKNDGGARALCNLGEYKGDNPKDVLCAYRDVFDNVLGQPAPQQPIESLYNWNPRRYPVIVLQRLELPAPTKPGITSTCLELLKHDDGSVSLDILHDSEGRWRPYGSLGDYQGTDTRSVLTAYRDTFSDAVKRLGTPEAIPQPLQPPPRAPVTLEELAKRVEHLERNIGWKPALGPG